MTEPTAEDKRAQYESNPAVQYARERMRALPGRECGEFLMDRELLENMLANAWLDGGMAATLDLMNRRHEEAVAERAAKEPADGLHTAADEMEKALQDSARSLCSIYEQAGKDEFMTEFIQVRGYAKNRAAVALDALAAYRAAKERHA